MAVIGKVVVGQSSVNNVIVRVDRPITSNIESSGGSVTVGTNNPIKTVKVNTHSQTSITSPSLIGEKETLNVLDGGTGRNYLDLNGVLIGNGINPITSLTSNNEGELLTIDANGSPSLGMLSGGTF
ncbi:hypothetical protein M0R04_04060 [Candidatus Dojkabacteria bacterium]|jgi:hypothetical protein|nr:hypothetical protein [Candidatus Dojkabacteria bacterium]